MNSHNRDQEPIPALRLHRFGDIFSPSCYNIVDFSICALLLSTSKRKTVMEVIPMKKTLYTFLGWNFLLFVAGLSDIVFTEILHRQKLWQ